jgi:O-antigen/teichoic acid export membrane protein
MADPAPDLPPGSRQVAKGAGTALLARAGAVIEIVSQPLYVWLFGLPTYGLYMVLWSAVNLAENIFDLGMTNALQRVVPQATSDEERADALRSALILGVGPCLAVAALASFSAPWLAPLVNVAAKDAHALETGIRLFAWSLPLWAFIEIGTSALRARKAFGPEIRLRVLWEQVIRMIAATILWALGAGALGLLLAHLCSLAVTCIFSARLMARYYPIGLVFRLRGGAMIRRTLIAGVSILPSNIVARLFADAPPLILNAIIPGAAGAAASGLFAIARKIASAVQLVRMAFTYVMAPLASEAVRHDKRHVAEIYGFATRLSMVVAVPIVAAIVGTGTAILGLFGPGGQAAWWALALLTVTRMIEAITGQAGSIQAVISRYHHPLLSSFVGLGAALIAGLLLLPQGGIDGMAIAVSAGIVVSNLMPMLMLWYSQRLHPFAPPFLRTATSTAIAAAAILLLTGLASPLTDAPRLLLCGLLILAGIWSAARIGLSHADKIALGKTARRLKLL